MQHVFLSVLLFLLIGCTSTQSKKFCTNSGFAEGTLKYDSCLAKNKPYRAEIRYCMDHYNIYKEGKEAKECLAKAREIKIRYINDYETCKTEVENKYSRDEIDSTRSKRHYHYIYNSQGQIIETITVLQEEVPQSRIDSRRGSAGMACMVQKGWNSYGSVIWKIPKNRLVD